ncbi:MAG: emrB [Caulobacteraceae bacterium]|nr:emrB [Caulobacteraceae bacterium]
MTSAAAPAKGDAPNQATADTAARQGSPAGLPDKAGPMSTGAMILAGFVLAMANFMAVLDTTIANVALPHIAGSLAASPNEGTSVITFFAVAEAITIPLTGWLAQRFGMVKVFFASMAGFGIFSALCGFAPTLPILIFFRILQGMAAGPMMPLSQGLLLRIVPPKQHAMATSLWAMTVIVAPIAGPLLGGWIADNVGWAWCFYINVPVAILSVAFGWRLLAPHETPTARKPIDFVGLALLIFWVGSMQTMLDIGKKQDWFGSPLVVGLLVATIVGLAAFCIYEWTEEHPIVDLRVFKNFSLTISTVTMALVFGIYFGSTVVIPLWLQTNIGYTATWAGYVMAFNGILAVMAAPLVGKLIGKFDPRALVCFGLLGMAIVMGSRTFFTPNMTFWQMAQPQLLQGAFMPFFFLPLMTVALGTIPPKDIANGAAMITFVRTVAGAVAASIMATYWEDQAEVVRGGLVGAVRPEFLGPAGQNTFVVDRMVQSQAVMVATNHVFLVVAVGLLISAGAIWLAPKPTGRGRPAGGGGH